MRRWIELAVDVPADAADAVAARLLELGAPGTIEEDLGDGRTRVRAHYAESADAAALGADLRRFLATAAEFFAGLDDAAVTAAPIDEEDWAESWRRGFPPLDVGARIRVRPPWEAPVAGRVDVEIEPAMAFGTGQHASTVGCLLAIEELFAREGSLSPVLDVGTGSGILAIAAAKLGADDVRAVDYDPVAVAAARRNFERNGVRVRAVVGSAGAVRRGHQLVVANLYSAVLRELSAEFARLVLPRGWVVLSGFLDHDRDEVAAAFAAEGFAVESARSLDGWTTLVLRSPAR